VLGLADFSNIEGFRHFLTDSFPGNRWVFPNGWRAERNVAHVTIFPLADKKKDPRSPGLRPVPVSVETRSLKKRPSRWPHRQDRRAVVDADRLVGPLRVGRWEPGDRFRPLGLDGHKKLQDFFVDRKVPAPVRRRIPIVSDREKIVWIVGHEISDWVKVDRSTRRFLELTLPEGDAESDAS